jgi:hypothetical protein
MASTPQVFARPRVYMGMAMDPRALESQQEADDVRCVECSTEYRLPAGAAAACPSCACPTWISARIPGPALRPSLGSA